MTQKTNQVEALQKILGDPLWRINNLYHIVDKQGQKVKFKLNWAQEQLYKNIWYNNIVLKARQLGVSTFVGLLFLDRALFNPNLSCGIIAHTREDSETFFTRIKYAYDNLPPEIKTLRTAENDTKNELTFNNGSSIRVGMLMRGSTLQYLHISEFGKISAQTPDKAREIVSGSMNAIAPGGYIFIESTAEGREGHFFEMCKRAQELKDNRKPLSKLDFRFHFYDWMGNVEYSLDPSGITIPADLTEYFDGLESRLKIKIDDQQRAWYCKKAETQKDDMRREYPSTPEESFESAADGAYYAKYLTQARQEGRITKLFIDPTRPVHSAWDLGYNDSTAIFLFQIVGMKIHVLEYFENSGEALPFYCTWLKSKGYLWGIHLAPHDVENHELSSGLTRTEVGRSLGINFVQVPRIKEKTTGIDAVRNILHRCYFDEEKCSQGVKMLDNYKKKWNARHGCWGSQPLHNFASHGADSFMTLATGLNLIDSSENGSIKEDYKAINAYFSRGF